MSFQPTVMRLSVYFYDISTCYYAYTRLSGFNYHSHSWLGLWVSIKLSGVSVSSSCRGIFSKG